MDVLTDVHFLRPLWLLLIPILLLFAYWLSRQGQRQTGFEQWIDANLLRHLITDDTAINSNAAGNSNATGSDNQNSPQKKQHAISRFFTRPIYLLLAGAWIIACIALAGPTWEKLPQLVQQSEQAMVIILDLSPSMRATDNKPSRIVRARLKIKDLLSQRKDGLTALVVYAGEAHTVTPLTDDTKTIANLLSTLTPGLLPIPGSNIEMAMNMATDLVTDSGIQHASYVLLTDGIDPNAVRSIERTLEQRDHQSLFIIGVGTPEGAPIPSDGGNSNSAGNTGNSNNSAQTSFLRDGDNKIIRAARNDAVLQQVAAAVNGHYLPLQASDADINFILQSIDRPAFQNQNSDNTSQREMDQWEEFAPLLLLVFLPLFALMFRRGWLLMLIVIVLPVTLPEPVYAQTTNLPKDQIASKTTSALWDVLWRNKNQQGKQAFEQQNYSAAEQRFSDSKNHQWQGSAAYKNKDYQAAVEAFAKGNTATDDYNRGNALGQLQQYDEAIDAYNSALKKDPTLSDAKKNRDIIEQIKAQQQEQQQDGEGKEGDDNKDQENKNGDQQSPDNSENNSSNDKDESNESQQQDPGEQGEKSDSDKSEAGNDTEEQTAEEKAEEERQAAEQQNKDDKNNSDEQQDASKQAQQLSAFDQLSTEEKQELEQWIQKIPDDPSGLLRRKFEYEFQKRRELYQSGDWKLPDNNAHERY